MSRDKKHNKDRSVTVRFNHDEAEALLSIAKEYHTTLSDVVRSAAKGELDKHLSHVKFVDAEHSRIINSNIIKLGNVIQEARDHLRRIGVNFNQVARRVNAGDMSALNDSGALITREELDRIAKRIEQATSDAGEIMKCIAG